MLIANTSFRTVYEGEEIQIVAGQTAIDRTHDLARAFPDHWTDEIAGGNGHHHRDDVVDQGQRHARSTRLDLADELRLRAERLRELAERELARPAPAAVAEDAFWSGVARQLEDPRQAAEDRAGVALIDQMDAARARGARDEIGALSAWLRG